ncbi:MAG: alpha/beta hydrolase, partial [Saprospiraceae bacterium]
KIALIIGMFWISSQLIGQEIPLWKDLHPIAKNVKEKIRIAPSGDHVISNIHFPSIKPYLPDPSKATRAAVIIIPGGGHRELWIDHEGYNIASWLKEKGVAAFVLKYRLAKDSLSSYTIDGEELSDVQQAIRMVRSHSKEWGIKSDKIGVMGFSAGGEIAGLASMRFNQNKTQTENIRPDFQALIYPGGIARLDTVHNAPPLFLCGGNKDRDDIAKGLAELYLKYRTKGIPAELHIYSQAGHGFGLRTSTTGAVKTWLDRFLDWMQDSGIVSK